jgi:hypothetical protein
MDPRTREVTRLWTLAVPAVSSFVASLVRDFQDCDDVLRDTAVAVVESFDQYDPARPFLAWALGGVSDAPTFPAAKAQTGGDQPPAVGRQASDRTSESCRFGGRGNRHRPGLTTRHQPPYRPARPARVHLGRVPFGPGTSFPVAASRSRAVLVFMVASGVDLV